MLKELLRKALDMGDLVFIETRYEFQELSNDLIIGHGTNTYGLYLRDNNDPMLQYIIKEDTEVTGWFLRRGRSTAPVDRACATGIPELGIHLACFYFGGMLLISEYPIKAGSTVRWSGTAVKFVKGRLENDK